MSTTYDLVTQLASGFGSPSARRVGVARGPAPRPVHAPALAPEVLAEIVQGLALAEDLWRPHVAHDPRSRTSVRLIATPAYEVWLLGWTAGQRVQLHDHGGSEAAFTVVEGELDELRLHGGRIDRVRHRTGATATVASGTIHDVVHGGAGPATSIHAYAAPLRSMTFYEPDGTPSFHELVEEVPALVDASATARALHPSGR